MDKEADKLREQVLAWSVEQFMDAGKGYALSNLALARQDGAGLTEQDADDFVDLVVELIQSVPEYYLFKAMNEQRTELIGKLMDKTPTPAHRQRASQAAHEIHDLILDNMGSLQDTTNIIAAALAEGEDARSSLAQEIRETLAAREHWAPQDSTDLITAVAVALDKCQAELERVRGALRQIDAWDGDCVDKVAGQPNPREIAAQALAPEAGGKDDA